MLIQSATRAASLGVSVNRQLNALIDSSYQASPDPAAASLDGINSRLVCAATKEADFVCWLLSNRQSHPGKVGLSAVCKDGV